MTSIGKGAFVGAGTSTATVALPVSSAIALSIGKDAFKGFGTATPDGALVDGSTIVNATQVGFANSPAVFKDASIDATTLTGITAIEKAFQGAKFTGLLTFSTGNIIAADAFKDAELGAGIATVAGITIPADAFKGANLNGGLTVTAGSISKDAFKDTTISPNTITLPAL